MRTFDHIIGYHVSVINNLINIAVLVVILIVNLILSAKFDVNDYSKNGAENTRNLKNVKWFYVRVFIWSIGTLILGTNVSFLPTINDEQFTSAFTLTFAASGLVYFIVCYFITLIAAKRSKLILEEKRDFYLDHNLFLIFGQSASAVTAISLYALILDRMDLLPVKASLQTPLSWVITVVYIILVYYIFKGTKRFMKKSIESSVKEK